MGVRSAQEGAVEDQLKVSVGQDSQGEPGEEAVWQLELDETTEPLVAHVQLARELDMGL